MQGEWCPQWGHCYPIHRFVICIFNVARRGVHLRTDKVWSTANQRASLFSFFSKQLIRKIPFFFLETISDIWRNVWEDAPNTWKDENNHSSPQVPDREKSKQRDQKIKIKTRGCEFDAKWWEMVPTKIRLCLMGPELWQPCSGAFYSH